MGSLPENLAWSRWHRQKVDCSVLRGVADWSPTAEHGIGDRTGALGRRAFIWMGLAIMLSLACAQPTWSSARPESGELSMVVEFSYFDSRAAKVSVVGSFNQWAPDAHVMKKDGDRWSLEVLLPPGRHEYAFLIDDRVWKADPASLVKEKSGFGSSNSILIVE